MTFHSDRRQEAVAAIRTIRELRELRIGCQHGLAHLKSCGTD